jgi:hypothetical protein
MLHIRGSVFFLQKVCFLLRQIKPPSGSVKAHSFGIIFRIVTFNTSPFLNLLYRQAQPLDEQFHIHGHSIVDLLERQG